MMINGLKYLRTRCNYSQHELAEILDVTDAMISKWENDNKVISEERQEELAETIGGDNTDRFGGIRGAINEIEKGCKRYSFMTRFLRHKNTVDRGLKAPYMYELLDVFYALELAFNMRPETEEEIERFTRIRGLRMIDEEYVRKLAIMIKEHWDLQKEYHIKEMEKWKEEDEAYE